MSTGPGSAPSAPAGVEAQGAHESYGAHRTPGGAGPAIRPGGVTVLPAPSDDGKSTRAAGTS
ncbi:hypothetical protein [Streptomyces sp. NPDC018610]|uniref:hypothetical protein n=1 Tax=Streptomyces sp. NPDC018610 TaxID=3365049 RepID=UPI0037B2ED2C